MTVGLIFLMALVSVVAALVLLIRTIGVRRVLRHATIIDIIFTLVVCFLLAGTLTGLLIGIVAGLVMTGILTVAKALMKRIEAARIATARDVTEPEDWCPGGTPSSL